MNTATYHKHVSRYTIDDIFIPLVSDLKLMVLALLESGNTVYGGMVANKILRQHNNQCDYLYELFDSSKRVCHGCMKPLYSPTEELVCANILFNACKKLYCKMCVVKFQKMKGESDWR